jgi:hypothetical protein
MYLVTLDAEICHTSDGSRSLDNVVLELLARMDSGESFRINKFLSLVPEDLQTVAEYRGVASGKRL